MQESNVTRVSFFLAYLAVIASVPANAQTTSERTVLINSVVQQPNIIFILTDDQRYDDVDSMPNVLSLIAAQGTVFTNAFVPVALCCPSRVSILRGQLAHNTGVLTNSPPDGGFSKVVATGLENSMLGLWMQQAGYQTGLFGKYINGYPEETNPTYVPIGWNEWQAAIGNGVYFDYDINENGVIVHYGSDTTDYEADVLTRKVTSYIRDTSGPFFAYIAPSAAHRTPVPPPRYEHRFDGVRAPHPESFDEADLSDKPLWLKDSPPLTVGDEGRINGRYRKRLGTLLAIDDMVDSIVTVLTATGKLDNTYIIFTSDNGFEQGEHRIKQGKQTPYEEAIRVPLLVRGPGVAIQVRDDLISNIDFAPTFLEIAGGHAGVTLDGRSMMPLLTHIPMLSPWRAGLLVEHVADSDTSEEGRTITSNELLRTNDKVLVQYSDGEWEYYDLATDPYQLENLAGGSLPSNLVTMLAKLTTCVGGDCFPGSLPVQQFVDAPRSYPNPFNPVTTISFLLQKRSHVTVTLYNVLGQEVERLLDGEELEAGQNAVLVKGENLASGTYLCRIETEARMQVVKLILLK